MGSRRGHLAVAAVALVATVAASAASGSTLRILVRGTPNKTESNRTRSTINGIVIHDTEGRFIGSVRALQNPRVDGSAHFVVSRRGQIVQLVPVTDVAWHSGNSWWNLHSIGIEHEGWAGRRSYTEKEYRASAQLVAYLAHRWSIPLDREHIIGHAEVPDPYHRGRYGGVSHHTDPGPHWNWGHYMALVDYYSTHRVLPHFVKRMRVLPDAPMPHLPVARAAREIKKTLVRATQVHVTAPARHVVTRSTVDRNAAVRGSALWWSGVTATTQWRRHIWKVEFQVDGKTLYSDHTWPYSFHRTEGWNTRSVTNGRHMLTVRIYGARHYRVRKSVPVRVVNPPLRVAVTGAVSGGAVSGVLKLVARMNETVARVALYADGKLVSRDGRKPYSLTWNTADLPEGEHALVVYARGTTHRAALELPVVVANNPDFPATLARNWVTHRIDSDAFGRVPADG